MLLALLGLMDLSKFNIQHNHLRVLYATLPEKAVHYQLARHQSRKSSDQINPFLTLSKSPSSTLQHTKRVKSLSMQQR